MLNYAYQPSSTCSLSRLFSKVKRKFNSPSNKIKTYINGNNPTEQRITKQDIQSYLRESIVDEEYESVLYHFLTGLNNL